MNWASIAASIRGLVLVYRNREELARVKARHLIDLLLLIAKQPDGLSIVGRTEDAVRDDLAIVLLTETTADNLIYALGWDAERFEKLAQLIDAKHYEEAFAELKTLGETLRRVREEQRGPGPNP